MPDEADKSVLQRMAAARAEAVGLTKMTAVKALRNAVAKAGDVVLNTVVTVRDISESVIAPDDLVEGLPDPALFLRLEGPDGALGIAVACPQVVGAVIEATTMGTVLHAAAADRRPTRTDAMLASAMLDATLEGFAALARGCAMPPPVDGFRCGMALPDARAAQMMAADVAHRSYRMDLVFNGDAKTGQLVLIFPSERGSGGSKSRQSLAWHATLENAVMGTAARLEAQLCKLKLPLRDITGLSVGDVLPLDGASLDGVTLVGSSGQKVMTARLGRSGHARAVRLVLGGKAPRKTVPRVEASPSAAVAAAGGQGAGLNPQEATAAGAMAPDPQPVAMDPAPLTMEPAAMEADAMAVPGPEVAMEPQPLDMPDLVPLPAG